MGFCVLKKRQGCRQAFMKKNDMLIAPYYIKTQYRGRGMASAMLKAVCQHSNQSKGPGGNFYALVNADNVASLKALECAGFKKIGFLKQRLRLFQIVTTRKTGVVVMRWHP